jgi:Pyruvate/2-oxoacid:ferredoxin oxidoreductase delta subunit
MALRKIIEIDEGKCNGCGKCIPNCAEGALQVVDGKARLVSEVFCDGLGACLGTCPQDAIRIVEREAEDFDEQAAVEHVRRREPAPVHACPGAAVLGFAEPERAATPSSAAPSPSALTHWPVQITLAPVQAPFYGGADLLLAADCVPFAFADFHRAFLQGRKVLIGCPKLDNAQAYVGKIAEILARNEIASLTVVHMEVPCCSGLTAVARKALEKSGSRVPLEDVTIGIRGDVLSRRRLSPSGAVAVEHAGCPFG